MHMSQVPIDISGLRRYVHSHDHLIKNTGYNGTKERDRTRIHPLLDESHLGHNQNAAHRV